MGATLRNEKFSLSQVKTLKGEAFSSGRPRHLETPASERGRGFRKALGAGGLAVVALLGLIQGRWQKNPPAPRLDPVEERTRGQHPHAISLGDSFPSEDWLRRVKEELEQAGEKAWSSRKLVAKRGLSSKQLRLAVPLLNTREEYWGLFLEKLPEVSRFYRYLRKGGKPMSLAPRWVEKLRTLDLDFQAMGSFRPFFPYVYVQPSERLVDPPRSMERLLPPLPARAHAGWLGAVWLQEKRLRTEAELLNAHFKTFVRTMKPVWEVDRALLRRFRETTGGGGVSNPAGELLSDMRAGETFLQALPRQWRQFTSLREMFRPALRSLLQEWMKYFFCLDQLTRTPGREARLGVLTFGRISSTNLLPLLPWMGLAAKDLPGAHHSSLAGTFLHLRILETLRIRHSASLFKHRFPSHEEIVREYAKLRLDVAVLRNKHPNSPGILTLHRLVAFHEIFQWSHLLVNLPGQDATSLLELLRAAPFGEDLSLRGIGAVEVGQVVFSREGVPAQSLENLVWLRQEIELTSLLR
jgi:hypothetical protein